MEKSNAKGIAEKDSGQVAEKKNFGYIQLTRKCDQECVFCSNPYVDDTLSLEDAKKQVDYYVDECRVNEIILSGGEPTLNPELPEIIKYIVSKKAAPRIITNGQKIADKDFLKILVDAGLSNVMVSIYSHDRELHDKLTVNKGSYDNVMKALANLSEFMHVLNINITINSQNVKTLDQTAKFLVEKFPKIRHFVFNNLDFTGRAKNNPWTVPRLVEIELPLHKTLAYLKSVSRTFRVERVPLCYIAEFAEFSTETRRIVKEQAYRCLFLDENGRRQFEKKDKYYYLKFEQCKSCRISEICAGLNERYDALHGHKELYALFIDPDKIVLKVDSS